MNERISCARKQSNGKQKKLRNNICEMGEKYVVQQTRPKHRKNESVI